MATRLSPPRSFFLTLVLLVLAAVPAAAQTPDAGAAQVDAALAANRGNAALDQCLAKEPAVERYQSAIHSLANVSDPKQAPKFNASGIGASWQEKAPEACVAAFERDRARNVDEAWIALQACGWRATIEQRRPAFLAAANKCLTEARIAVGPVAPVTPPTSTGQADAWSRVPTFDQIRGQILGRDAFAVIGGAEWRVFDNAGRLRALPGFLADRIQAGYAVLNDRAWLQGALASFRTNMTLDEVVVSLERGAPDVAKQHVVHEATCPASFGSVPRSGPGLGTMLVPVVQYEETRSCGLVRHSLPRASVVTELEPFDQRNEQAKTSEFSSIRGTINGGGDFIRFDLDGPRPGSVPPPQPRILRVASRPGPVPVAVRGDVRLDLPTAVVLAEGGPARVVADLAPNGAAAVVVTVGRAQVREVTTGTSRLVNRGEAVLVWPGLGVSQPMRVSAERFAAAARPRIRGSIVLRPGERWAGRLRLDPVLPIEGRVVSDKPGGSAYALEIAINGRSLTDPLINKTSPMRYADGRNFPYLEPNTARWMLFYSQDYAANNGPAGGRYEVLTDPGQAYRYVWDVASLYGGNETAQVEFRNVNTASSAALELRLLPAEAVGMLTRQGPALTPGPVTSTTPPPPSTPAAEPKKPSGFLQGLADALKEVAKGVSTPPSPPAAGATGAIPPPTVSVGRTSYETREQEPNNDSATAMLVQPGTAIDGALTAGAVQGRATDIDFYRVPVASPGLYTITVTPALPECGYATGLPDLRDARGPSTMTVELTGQRRTNYTLQFGGRPEERSSASGEEPRELLIAVDTRAWSSSSDRGAQCARDGAWHKEIPYRLTIVAGGPAPSSTAARPAAVPASRSASAWTPPPAPGAGAGGGAVIRGEDFGEAAVPGRISNIVTARDVQSGNAIGITDTFTPDLNPIHVWFRLSGFAPGTMLTSRWSYFGARDPMVIGTGEFTTPPAADYGTFSYELAAGKRWPAGEYRVEILLGSTVLGSAAFTVRGAP